MQLLVLVWALGSWAVICAAYDIRQRRIPNYLTLSAYGMAIAAFVFEGQGWLGGTVLSCLEGWGIGLLLTMPAYLMKLLGAGDVKMLSAIGLLVGLESLLLTYVIASVIMAGLAVFYGLFEYLKRNSNGGSSAELCENQKRRMLPFGFGFSVGLLSVLLLKAKALL